MSKTYSFHYWYTEKYITQLKFFTKSWNETKSDIAMNIIMLASNISNKIYKLIRFNKININAIDDCEQKKTIDEELHNLNWWNIWKDNKLPSDQIVIS